MNDASGKDIFFHFDDIRGTGLSRHNLSQAGNNNYFQNFKLKFAFNVLIYAGKYGPSYKAVDITL